MQEYSSYEIESMATESGSLEEDIESIHHRLVAQVQLDTQEKIEKVKHDIREWAEHWLESENQTEALRNIWEAQNGGSALIYLLRNKCKISIQGLEVLRDYRLSNVP